MNEIINQILGKIRARNYSETKELLDELDTELEKIEKLEKFFDDIKSLIRNLGKSNTFDKSEIQEVINQYEN